MSSRLYVSNIAPETTEGSLRTYLVNGGFHVLWTRIRVNQAAGYSRGFAFAEFEGDGEAVDALASLQKVRVDGRCLVLEELHEPNAAN